MKFVAFAALLGSASSLNCTPEGAEEQCKSFIDEGGCCMQLEWTACGEDFRYPCKVGQLNMECQKKVGNDWQSAQTGSWTVLAGMKNTFMNNLQAKQKHLGEVGISDQDATWEDYYKPDEIKYMNAWTTTTLKTIGCVGVHNYKYIPQEIGATYIAQSILAAAAFLYVIY